MLMPEAAMHKNDLAAAREHQIGRAGQVFPMQPEPVAETMRQAAHG
jgi:hypothetical protein